jgi:L-ascorbate metabolism protein UlaG (beta-lactamase superfamily)
MICPVQKDEALLADMAAASNDFETLHLWWLGQSGFLVQHNGVRFLFDPYLSDSLTQKYAATDKPHVRMTERCVDPHKLTGIQWVTATHAHTDHLDGETLRALAVGSSGYTLVLPGLVVDEAMRRLGEADVNLMELNQNDASFRGGIQIHGVPAAHNEIVMDDYARSQCVGYIVKLGPFSIYHSGDTLWHPEILAKVREFNCDLMLLPINGNQAERRVAGNLNGTEAAAFAKACKARLVVPCHYEMFEFNTASPAEFVSVCGRLSQPHQVMRCGERLTLCSLRPSSNL